MKLLVNLTDETEAPNLVRRCLVGHSKNHIEVAARLFYRGNPPTPLGQCFRLTASFPSNLEESFGIDII